MVMNYSLSGVNIVTPQKVLRNNKIVIKNKKIKKIGNKEKLNLHLGKGYFLFPAFINVHDHLRGDYLPKIGPQDGQFYIHCHEWEKDLRASKVVKERSLITEEECYYLGAYKNLFSGVATVQDHYPHSINNKYIPNMPIRVIKNYTIHHEVTKYSLNWGEGIEVEHKRAVKKNLPFIVHLEEGFTKEYQQGVEQLEKLQILDDYDVLIHCIGLSDKDILKIKKAGSTIVWCPGSNFYMYNVTCKIKKIMKAGINVALGTDSTHTGSSNLLEEIRFARKMYKRMYGEVLDAKKIVEMVTVNPAKAFRIEEKIGSIQEEKFADLLLFHSETEDPYEASVQLNMEDIELLILEGNPIYGSEDFKDFFNIRSDGYTDIKVRGRKKFVKGDPKTLLKTIRKKVGYRKVLDYLPLDD